MGRLVHTGLGSSPATLEILFFKLVFSENCRELISRHPRRTENEGEREI
jgi:hypothetical protein